MIMMYQEYTDEIAQQLIENYQENVDVDFIYEKIIDKVYDLYHFDIHGSHNENVKNIMLVRIKQATCDIKKSGRLCLENIVSDLDYIKDIEQDNQGNLLIGKYLEKLMSCNGSIFKKIEEQINAIDFSDIIEQIRFTYINQIEEKDYSKEDAKAVLDQRFPGIKIFELDNDKMTDLLNELRR